MQRTYAAALALAGGIALGMLAQPARAGNDTVLHSFQSGSDGAGPSGGLINVGGTLYGTTQVGGAPDNGTVFALNPTTGAEQVVYSFQGGGSDGATPRAGLIDVGGALYGTTAGGGTANVGTVYSVNPVTGVEKLLHSFLGRGHGAYPYASMISDGAKLYGTTIYGGAATDCSNCGTVFSLNPTTAAEKVVQSLQGSDGANPEASLISVGGTLYGTTGYGGGSANCGSGCGTVFLLSPKTGVIKLVYAFKGSDGAHPVARLLDVGGTLYGTTGYGGASANCAAGCGTVFSLNPKTGTEQVLYSFRSNPDGALPLAGLIDVGGMLYGTTSLGGSASSGTVFSLDPTTGVEQVVYSFQSGSDGAHPQGSLINVGGTLYGTTFGGGAYNCGTAFAIAP